MDKIRNMGLADLIREWILVDQNGLAEQFVFQRNAGKAGSDYQIVASDHLALSLAGTIIQNF